MTQGPEISVVTATYNGLAYTRVLVETLRATMPQSTSWECLLVDDGSADDTRDFLRTLSAPFRVVFNDRNLGFAASNNRGAREARGAVLACLNNDLVLRGDWLRPLLNELGRPRTGWVGNVQRAVQTGRIDHAGVIFNPVGIPEHYGKDYLFLPPGGKREFRAVTAACCLMRREFFLDAGGFDEGFRNGLEDIDFCLRSHQRGWIHRVVRSSVVGHHVSVSPGRKDQELTNQRRFLERWGEQTRKWGLEDWPGHYLWRHLRSPWKLNGPKAGAALVRVLGLRRQRPPAWALNRRRELDSALAGLPVEEKGPDE